MRDANSWFRSGAATHVGKVRQHNEDSFLVLSKSGVWAVADGMGGHAAGDVASRTVVEELGRISEPSSVSGLLASFEERVVAANDRLKELSASRGWVTIGTTVAALLIYEEVFACVWAGDSRIYRARKSRIEQLSVDHTEVQQLVESGTITAEEARSWPGRNVITRAIGAEDSPELEMLHGTLEPGDAFVLCSDGLTNHVSDQEILAAVLRCSPQAACDDLIGLTLSRGASDNVTVVVVRFDPVGATLPPGVAQSGLIG
jgi:protein phosphatase